MEAGLSEGLLAQRQAVNQILDGAVGPGFQHCQLWAGHTKFEL